MSQTLSYDQTGTDSSDSGKIYDIDFFPGAVFNYDTEQIDQVELDLTKMIIHIITYPNRIIEGEIKEKTDSWGTRIMFSQANVVKEYPFILPNNVEGVLKVVEIEQLDINVKYDFRVRSVQEFSYNSYGNYVYAEFTTFYPIGENGLVKVQSLTNPSLLAPVISDQVVNKDINGNSTPWNYDEYSEFWKNVVPTNKMPELKISSNTVTDKNKKISQSIFSISKKDSGITLCSKLADFDINNSYFSFGTKMFFTEWQDKLNAPQGGLAFFLNPSGSQGYAIVVKTTESNTVDQSKELASDVSIVKIESANKFKKIPDSQGNLSQSFSGITSAEQYTIDIQVNCSDPQKNIITAYINNKKIVAIDDSKPLAPTKTIGLFAMKGECNFDYVYAYPLSLTLYNRLDLEGNRFLTGKVPFSGLSIAYGEKVANINSQEYQGYYEEFGPTAKEILVLEEKFTSGNPGYSKFFSTGVNYLVQILSQKSNNFGFKAYLINNSSSTIPVSSTEERISLSMIGNTVITGEKAEFNTDEENKYINDELVILESSWIQRKSDAEKMANWLKEQWSKNTICIKLKVFGNPFIAVGDLVTISYPRSGITESTTFLVTVVEQSFNGGIETVLECRSLNSYS